MHLQAGPLLRNQPISKASSISANPHSYAIDFASKYIRSVFDGSGDDQIDQGDPISEALKRGEFPDAILEAARIVDPNLPAAKQFSAAMWASLQGMWQHEQFRSGEIRFLLSDSPGCNAFFLKGSRPPAIALTREMVESIGQKPALLSSIIANAWVGGHEFLHAERNLDLGDQHRVGKEEEATAYAIPLRRLCDLGINPEPVLDVARELLKRNKTRRSYIDEVLDVHPVPETIVAILKESLRLLRAERGNFATLPHPTQRELIKAKQAVESFDQKAISAISSEVRHQSYLEKMLTSHVEYKTDKPSEKVKVLSKIFEGMQEYYPIRVADVIVELKKIRSRAKNRGTLISAVDEFADVILEKIAAGKIDSSLALELWGSLSSLAHSRRTPNLPLGRLKRIATACDAFVDQVGVGGHVPITSSARALMRSLKSEAFFRDEELRECFLQKLRWPTFPHPSLRGIASGTYLEERAGYRLKLRRPARRSAIKSSPVAWQALRYSDRWSPVVLDAAFAVGLWRDPGIHASYSRYPTLALKHYKKVFERRWSGARELDSDNRYVLPELCCGPKAGRNTISDLRLQPNGKVSWFWQAENRFQRLPSEYSCVAPVQRTSRYVVDRVIDEICLEVLGKTFAVDSKVAHAQFRSAKDVYLRGRSQEALFGMQRHPKSEPIDLIGAGRWDRDVETFRRLNAQALRDPNNARWFMDSLLTAYRTANENGPAIRQVLGIYPDGRMSAFDELADFEVRRAMIEVNEARRRLLRGQDVSHKIRSSEERTNHYTLFRENPYARVLFDDSAELLNAEQKHLFLAANISFVSGSTVFSVDRIGNAVGLLELTSEFAKSPRYLALYNVDSWLNLIRVLQKEGFGAAIGRNVRRISENKPGPYPSTDILDTLDAELVAATITKIINRCEPTADELFGVLSASSEEESSATIRAFSLNPRIQSALATIGTEADVKESARRWILARVRRLFQDGLELEILPKILDRLETDLTARERFEVLTNILRSGILYRPGVRARVINQYARDYVTLFGVDDKSPEYTKDFIERLTLCLLPLIGSERSNADTQPARLDKAELFYETSKAVVAQSTLCDEVNKHVEKVSVADQARAHILGVFTDGILTLTRHDALFSKDLLNFLIEPLSNISIRSLIESQGENFRNHLKYDSQPMIMSGPEKALEVPLRIFHENYRIQHIAVQSAALAQLLAPQVPKGNRGIWEPPDKISQKTFDFVLSKVIPDTDQSPFATQVRRFIQKFVEKREPYERYGFLGAILAAAQQTAEVSTISLQERIVLVLEHAGVFERKCGQKVPGMPGISLEFAEPFEHLTDSAAEPPRPEIVADIEARRSAIEVAYNSHLTSIGEYASVTIAHIGPVRGSASIAVTTELTMSNGKKLAIALRRPHALEQGLLGADTAEQTVAELQAEDIGKSDAPDWNSFLGVIRHTASRLRLETDFSKAPEQYQLGGTMFNRLRVVLDGNVHSFSAPEVVGTGEDFFLMEFVEGPSMRSELKRLAKENKAEMEDRCQVGLAAHAYRLASLLFDFDRHIGQEIAVQARHTAELDFKATPLEPWPAQEIDAFGKVLSDTIRAILADEPFVTAVRNNIAEVEKEKGSIELLREVNIALVHLNSLAKRVPGDMAKHAILSGFLQGIHPQLFNQLASDFELPDNLRDLLRAGKFSEISGLKMLFGGKEPIRVYEEAI